MSRRRDNVVNCRGGFTLVELLVVIAIIALLMSILMPALARVKKQAKEVVCQSNLKQWGVIFSMYTGDYNGYFHEGWFVGAAPVRHWMTTLRSYYGNEQKLRFCPAATKPRTEGARGITSAWGIFYGGWTGAGEDDFGSFGINSWVLNPPEGQEVKGPPKKYWRTADVKKAANVPLFLDAWWFDGWSESTNEPLEFEDIYISGNSMEAMGDFCVNRHNGFLDGLFLDFSVRKIGIKELWKLKWHRTFNTDDRWTIAGGVNPDDWPEWMQGFKDY
ncbi:MAG: type II secretion system protein [Planctomycetota bacterium]|jgi:prepilin-type N-terminal cleavage/methylation domain-containing protein